MKKEQFVKPGLIFLFILLLGLSGVGFYLLQQSVEAEELVVQTYEVIQIAQTILASVTDMETGVRGYIISGDERFLEPYYSGFPKNDSEITLLKRLTEDNAVQQSNITLLTSLIEKKQSICEVQMQLRRASGEEPAENHVSSGEGKVVMDSIRAVISAFMTVEKQLLKERLDKFHQSERQNLLFCSIIIIIQFCLFLLLAIVVLRYMKKQRMNRESIAKVNEELERQVKERTNNLEQSERAFRELSERNQAILDSVPDIIMEVNNDKEYIWANKTGIEFFGDDVIGKQASSYFLEEQDTYKVVEPLFKKESENVIYVESWQRRRDGEKRLLGWWCRALKDANGNVIGAISSAEDITERKLAEEHLAQLLRQNESILESIVDGIYGIDLNGNVTFINKAGARLLGYEQTELLGQHIHTLCHHTKKDGTPFPASECPIYLALTDGRVHREFDDVFWRKDGNKFPIEYISSPIVEDGTIVGAVVSFKDITERKKAEERIKHQAMLIDFINDAIIHLDAQYNILSWNKGAERMYGYTAEEAVGKNMIELLHIRSVHQLSIAETVKQYEKDGEITTELMTTTKDGRELHVEGRGSSVKEKSGALQSTLAIYRDITEHKKLEKQFLRTQRMESVGTLAGGIAHDLNNILTPVTLSLQILRNKLKEPKDRLILDTLETTTNRGANLVKQILTFARGTEGERSLIQLRHLVDEIKKFANETFPSNITIKTDIPKDTHVIVGDPTQIHQVLLNLCVNAKDAMPHGGTINIEAENAVLDEHYARMNLEAKVGQYVVLSFKDTGEGMPPDIKDKIFEPFFTTKERGKGTGLGLSTVYSIVKGHGGFINVYSEVGKGTMFKVYLPASLSGEIKKTSSGQDEIFQGHGELILLVEDEAAVREISKLALEANGYRVITANDGTEAVALFAQEKEHIKLVITDMNMPFMDGPALIRALQRMNPNVLIIGASGLADKEKIEEVKAAGIQSFLSKPYTAEKLTKTIADMLRRS